MIRLALIAAVTLLTQGLPAAAQEPAAADIYAAALRFYDPIRGVRWLDREMVDGADSLDVALARELLDRLGDDFEPWHGKPWRDGGVLQVSPLERRSGDEFALVVRYRHVSQWYEGPASDQAFVVRRYGERWEIASRGASVNP